MGDFFIGGCGRLLKAVVSTPNKPQWVKVGGDWGKLFQIVFIMAYSYRIDSRGRGGENKILQNCVYHGLQ